MLSREDLCTKPIAIRKRRQYDIWLIIHNSVSDPRSAPLSVVNYLATVRNITCRFLLANFRLHEYHKSTAISKKIDITVPVIIFVLKRKLIFTYPLNSLYEAYIMDMHTDTVSQKIDGKFIEV